MEKFDEVTTHGPTWTDPLTGLEWQRESPGRMAWHPAQSYARSLVLASRSDWRLPSVNAYHVRCLRGQDVKP